MNKWIDNINTNELSLCVSNIDLLCQLPTIDKHIHREDNGLVTSFSYVFENLTDDKLRVVPPYHFPINQNDIIFDENETQHNDFNEAKRY